MAEAFYLSWFGTMSDIPASVTTCLLCNKKCQGLGGGRPQSGRILVLSAEVLFLLVNQGSSLEDALSVLPVLCEIGTP